MRTHQVHYLLEPCADYVKAAVNTVVDLHREDVPGDVLVFLTGQVGGWKGFGKGKGTRVGIALWQANFMYML
jgi:hypothetical protein